MNTIFWLLFFAILITGGIAMVQFQKLCFMLDDIIDDLVKMMKKRKS